MLILIEEVSGVSTGSLLEEAAAAKGFTIGTDRPHTVGYWVSASLDAIDLIMISQGFDLTPAEMCNTALDAALEKIIPQQAAQGMMLIYNHRYLSASEHGGNMILVFLLNTDLRSLS